MHVVLSHEPPSVVLPSIHLHSACTTRGVYSCKRSCKTYASAAAPLVADELFKYLPSSPVPCPLSFPCAGATLSRSDKRPRSVLLSSHPVPQLAITDVKMCVSLCPLPCSQVQHLSSINSDQLRYYCYTLNSHLCSQVCVCGGGEWEHSDWGRQIQPAASSSAQLCLQSFHSQKLIPPASLCSHFGL